MEWFNCREAIANYLQGVYADGDWLNDWLTHMTPAIAAFMRDYGHAIVQALGL